MNKPTFIQQAPHLDWHDCVRYIEEKHDVIFRGFYEREIKQWEEENKDQLASMSWPYEECPWEYCDYWHKMVNDGDIHNGCFWELPSYWGVTGGEWYGNRGMESIPNWFVYLTRLIVTEFFPENLPIIDGETPDALFTDMRFWIDW